MLLQPLSKAVLQYYYTQPDYLESSSDRVAQMIQQQLERTPIASSSWKGRPLPAARWSGCLSGMWVENRGAAVFSVWKKTV